MLPRSPSEERALHHRGRRSGDPSSACAAGVQAKSSIAHAALLLFLMLASGEPGQRETTPPSAADRSTQRDDARVDARFGFCWRWWRRRQPESESAAAASTNRDGSLSTPTIVRAWFGSLQPEPPEQALVAPALLPQAGGTMNLPGALDPASFSAVSLGSGTGPGAGSGGGTASVLETGLGSEWAGTATSADSEAPARTSCRRLSYAASSPSTRRRRCGRVSRAPCWSQPSSRPTAPSQRARRQSLDGVFGLDQAAVREANQLVFRPATMDGQAVALAVTIELSSRCGRSGVSARIR